MWLLEQGARDALQTARKSGFKVNADQQLKFEARFSDDEGEGGRVLTIVGNTAEIAIRGVITQAPDIMALLFGGGNTTYQDIIQAIATAEANASVDNIVYAIDSPGGSFDGLFDALASMQAVTKPTKAIISGLGASAAFALATQADEVIASNIAARIGSVGVVATIDVYDDEISITSTNAPNKRPDVTTEEGVAMVREELDAMHDIFVDAIATGRGVSTDEVNKNFGRGGTLLATEAKKRGMIDAVAPTALKVVKSTKTTPATKSGIKTEASKMDLTTLKAQHPDVFAAAVKVGIDEERDRVGAHMTMGQASGDMKTACEAITAGTGMTQTLQAAYMTAGMNKRDLDNRASDDASASDTPATASDEPGADVAALVESKLGI